MKKLGSVIAVIILSALLVLELSPGTAGRAAEKGKTKEALQWLSDKGYLTEEFGPEKLLLKPEQIISREEFISLLMVMTGQKGKSSAVKSFTYADKEMIGKSLRGRMAAAEQQGILRSVKVKKKEYIYPKARLTRQMAAYYLASATGLHIDLEKEDITDYGKGSPNLIPYITAVLSADLIPAKGTTYRPLTYLTWEEAAGIVRRTWEAGYFNPSAAEILADGSGDSGNGLSEPAGITYAPDGTIYVADAGSSQIKKLKDGVITVVAGKGGSLFYESSGGFADGKASEAMFCRPTGICYIEEKLLIADTGNNCIRLLDLKSGEVHTYAGTGEAGAGDGDRKAARFNEPTGVTAGPDGTVYVADTGNACIRKITKDGRVTVLAGKPGQEGCRDGNAGEALLNRPTDLAYQNGVLYIADAGNQRIRRLKDGALTTVAGSGEAVYEGTPDIVGGYQDGVSSLARFDGPVRLAVDKKGTVYISDGVNAMIRKLENGRVSTLAGFGCLPADDAEKTKLSSPAGLFVSEKDGKLYVMDRFLKRLIRYNTVR